MVEMTPDQFRRCITNTVKNITAIEGTEGAILSQDGQTLNVWNVKITDTYVSTIFQYNTKLVNVDLKGLFIENNSNMFEMFKGCSSLTKLDLSNFDTSNVISMGYMFSGCSSLTELDISSFDTSNVNDMQHMFENCSSLTELDISNFDTSGVNYINYMFKSCSSLTKLDLSSFDTSNVYDMGYMFSYCSSLTELDISNFDTSVAAVQNMFTNCSNLSIIIDENKWTKTKTSNAYGGTNLSFYKKGAKYLNIYGNNVPLGDVYSKDEVVVGTWIDGKPIYRKVYTIAEKEYITGNNVIDGSFKPSLYNVINIRGMFTLFKGDNTVSMYTLPYSDGSDEIRLICTQSIGLLFNDKLNQKKYDIHIIVDYTKVSD